MSDLHCTYLWSAPPITWEHIMCSQVLHMCLVRATSHSCTRVTKLTHCTILDSSGAVLQLPAIAQVTCIPSARLATHSANWSPRLAAKSQFYASNVMTVKSRDHAVCGGARVRSACVATDIEFHYHMCGGTLPTPPKCMNRPLSR